MERHNLYMFRCEQRLSQEDMAKKIGVSRATYAFVENGKRDGSQAFWSAFQREFNIPDEEMYNYMKLKKGQENETKTQSSS